MTSLFQTWFVMILGSFHLLKMLGDKRKSFGEQFVENDTLVDDWSLMIMWLMLEIERES